MDRQVILGLPLWVVAPAMHAKRSRSCCCSPADASSDAGTTVVHGQQTGPDTDTGVARDLAVGEDRPTLGGGPWTGRSPETVAEQVVGVRRPCPATVR